MWVTMEEYVLLDVITKTFLHFDMALQSRPPLVEELQESDEHQKPFVH
jgi:hypothetical protein